MATTSTASRHCLGRPCSRVAKTCFERPSTMSNRWEEPVPSLIGVRSMMTVTYLSPRLVCLQTCSSTPMTLTPLKRCGSSIKTRRPSARTALFAVFQVTPRPSAILATSRGQAHDSLQRPAQPAAGKLSSGLGRFRGVLPPYVPAAGSLVAADTHEQRGGSPTKGFMGDLACHGVPGHALTSTLVAPIIRSGDAADDDRTIRADILPGHLESEAIKTAKSSQVRALKGSVEREGLAVENFDLDNLILYQGPHLYRNELSAPEFTHGNPDYTLDSEEPVCRAEE